MENRNKFRPFTGDSNRQVRLDAAPLQLVIVQVQWPEHVQLNSSFENAAKQFSSVLPDFPLVNEIEETEIKISPEGMEEVKGARSYQYSSVDGYWTIHLNRKFISLSCRAYPGYKFKDVLEKLSSILRAVEQYLAVEAIARVGVRYINRVDEEERISSLEKYFDQSSLGYQTLKIPEGVSLRESVSQAVFVIEDISFNVRSGLMAPGTTPDRALASSGNTAWALDLDAFQLSDQRFSPENVLKTVGRLSDTCYDFFKYVLLDAGESAFGGEDVDRS